MMKLKSPVTLSHNTQEIEQVPVLLIIDQYREAINIDVSRYFEGLNQISIYRCDDTGFRFYYPETIFGDAAFYAALQKRELYYSDWNWEHAQAVKNILPGSKVLEVGCGTGSFIETLNKKGFSCTGLELNNDAVAVCRQKGLNVLNELIEEHSQKHPAQYDVVCAFQVLEHVYDIHSFITACLACLKPGGKLIFAFPNNNPWYYIYDKYHAMNMPPHHSGLWSKQSFEKLSAYFPVENIRVKAEPLYNRNLFLQIWLKHKRYNRLLRISRKIHPGILNRLLWPLRLFINGKCLFTVLHKK
jgi:SAM-dependent methyltransferase